MSVTRSMLVPVAAFLIPLSTSAQTWQAAGTLPTGGAPRLYAAGVNANGVLYAVGGAPWVNGADGDGTVHRLVGGTWLEVAPLDGAGSVVSGAAGFDTLGRMVVYGGFLLNGDGAGPDKVYDPEQGLQGDIAARPAPAAAIGYFAWAQDDQGRLYGFGGGPGAGGPNAAYCDRYDAIGDSWTILAPLPTAAADACATYDGAGHMLVIGGINQAGAARLANVAQYDIATNTWSDTAVPDLPVALSGARAVLGADGRIYVMGGEVGPLGAGTTVATVYKLEPATLTWTLAAPMATPRRWFAAVLGSDDHIYAIGGDNDSGGTDQAEKLFTPRCPSFTAQPQPLVTWAGSVAGFGVSISGAAPFAYQWRKDGVDLLDGPTGTGSTISGATAPALKILRPGAADVGSYVVEVSNACGAVTSAAADLTLRTPPTLPAQWEVFDIHPAWAANGSQANGISQGRIGGAANTPTVLPDGRTFNLDHPVVWDATSFAYTDITPGGSVGGGIYDVEGDLLAGWFWHTWQCWGGGQYWTCAWQSAAFWTAPALTFAEALHNSGPEFDYVYGTDGVRLVGTLAYEYQDGFYDYQAQLWTADNHVTNLHFAGATDSSAVAIDGVHQYGWYLGGPSPSHAVMWTGSAASHVDLHPPGYSGSLISGAGDDQAVGTAGTHAGLWAAGGAAFVDLHPPAATSSAAVAAHQGVQAGSAGGAAALWTGAPETYFNLGAFVPPGFLSSTATDFEVGADGSFTVVGYGYNGATQRNEALVWRSQAPIPCAGDITGDLVIDLADLAVMQAQFGSTPPGASDLDGDGDVDLSDVMILVSGLGTNCR